MTTVNVFKGYICVNGTHVHVDFEAPANATDAEKDRAFLNALAEKVEYNYVVVGEIDKPGQATVEMDVSLDGGETYHPAPEGVRIIYKNVFIDGEDGLGELHLNATDEGLITDIWATRDEPLDHNIGTDSVLIEDLVSRLYFQVG